MNSLVIALPNDPTLAEEIGKKGTQNGITFYNRKSDTTTIVVLTPSDVNTKFYAIGEVVSIADAVLISTKTLDSVLGESIIAASLLGKKTIFTKENDISGILKSIAPPEYEFVERKDVLSKLLELKTASAEGDLRIDLDKAFPVKGVGTVLLGIVRSGKVRVHDSLKLSNGKDVLIRSIQVHDDDHEEAVFGDRVGLSVKGIDETDVNKGDILAKSQVPYVSSLYADIKKSPLAKDLDLENLSCTLISGFSVVNCKLSKKDNGFSVKLEKPVALPKNDSFILIRDKSPRVFASGKVI